jgi:hypothetical protein
MTESVLGPSGPGSVVLELGPGTGAIVLHAPPELDGTEIEISRDGPADSPVDGTVDSTVPGRRTHSQVRRRDTAAGARYAAVYPDVAEGDYTIWRHDDTPALRVRVAGGQVTTARWPEPDGGSA